METKYGLLLNDNITLHRDYFDEMVKLLGIQCVYRAPRPDKHYTTYSEISSNYCEPIVLGCIFTEHPDQRTLKKIGWVSELQENASLIHVPYDTPHLQQGSLFTLPSGLDDGKGRLFRVVSVSNIMVYPASVTCEIVPEYENTFENAQFDHKHDSLNLLAEEKEPLMVNWNDSTHTY